MRRIVIVGPGGSGKSTLARRLGDALDLPVIELDQHFWAPDLTPAPPERWAATQRDLAAGERWIIDGDLGPHDDLPVRLAAADTVLMLDFPLWRCVGRVLRRSRENLEFWRWLLAYRRRSRPLVLAAIAAHAEHADVHVLRDPRAVEEFVAATTTG